MAGLKKSPHHLVLIVSVVAFMTISGVSSSSSSSSSPPAIKAAYWPSWASNFTPSSIDTSLFTHVHYAFLMPHNITYDLQISELEHTTLANFTSTLRLKNPPVKTILSFGGGGADPAVFARMASNACSRKVFINSSIEIARKYGFDGVDLDWELPANKKEMHDLGLLLSEWRLALNKEADTKCHPRLLLTAAVYFSVNVFKDNVYRSYPSITIRKNLDWINVMCFDYSGSWNTSKTGAHAALFDPMSKVSTSYGIKSWIKAGLPAKKLVLGLPLYGRTWKLESNHNHGVRAPAVGVGPGVDGIMSYSEVVGFNMVEDAIVVFDAETVSAYSYAGNLWIGYDDQMSITMKIGFARAHGLRGYFFWAVNGDKDWKISGQASHAWGH